MARKLSNRWREVLDGFGVVSGRAEPILLDLFRRYQEPHRSYHTLAHLEEMDGFLDRLFEAQSPKLPARSRGVVDLALWFHDAYYNPRAKDNEAKSAHLAEMSLTGLGVSADAVAEVVRLIILTAGHRAEKGDVLGQIFLDADLGILGTSPQRYRRYAANIRHEFDWYDDEAYKRGRIAVLSQFLVRPRLFQTDLFFQSREKLARNNMIEERSRLRRAVQARNNDTRK